MSADHWVIYALGGGWGHLTRALALARVAVKYRPVSVLTNSRYAQYVSEPKVTVQTIAPNAGFDSACEQVQHFLSEVNYNCLIVDTFPRGLGGELANILSHRRNIARILIHRDINPKYLQAKQLRPFVAKHFDRVIVPGEGEWVPFADLPQTCQTPPWLIRHAEELPDDAAACTILRTEPLGTTKNIVILTSGKSEESRWYGTLAQTIAKQISHVTVRCLAPTCPENCPPELWISHWPALEALVAADIVIGGAGYNTFYECQALEIPFVTRPFWRLYDRQNIRLYRWLSGDETINSKQAVLAVRDLASAVNAIRQLLDTGPFRRSDQPNYLNGTIAATKQIAAVATNINS